MVYMCVCLWNLCASVNLCKGVSTITYVWESVSPHWFVGDLEQPAAAL